MKNPFSFFSSDKNSDDIDNLLKRASQQDTPPRGYLGSIYGIDVNNTLSSSGFNTVSNQTTTFTTETFEQMLKNQVTSDLNRELNVKSIDTEDIREEFVKEILTIPADMDFDANRQRAEKAIRELYTMFGLPIPTMMWFDSPYDALHCDLVKKSNKYLPYSFAFRHFNSKVFSYNRDSSRFGKQRKHETQILRVAGMVEKSYAKYKVKSRWSDNSQLNNMAIACLKYGDTWHGSRSYGEENDWEKIDAILQELAITTTGFMLTAKEAILIHRPTRIALNDLGVLDYSDGMAVEWRDGKGLHALKGVYFPLDDIYNRIVSHKLTTGEALGLVDVDQRRVSIGFLSPKAMIEAMKAELTDEGVKRHYKYYGRRIERIDKKRIADITISNKLYRTKFFNDVRNNNRFIPQWPDTSLRISNTSMNHDDFFTNSLFGRGDKKANPLYKKDTVNYRWFLHYTDPSTGEDYISFVTPAVEKVGVDADACMAFKHHMSKEEYLNLYLEA